MTLPVGSIYEQFERVSRDYPGKPALIYLGVRYSFSQLREATESLAASLHRLGVAKGDRAVLYLPNCPQWVTSSLVEMADRERL
jgi:acyl-CoA synthetase (AMP-forming)/AMP-acid ligase II